MFYSSQEQDVDCFIYQEFEFELLINKLYIYLSKDSWQHVYTSNNNLQENYIF